MQRATTKELQHVQIDVCEFIRALTPDLAHFKTVLYPGLQSLSWLVCNGHAEGHVYLISALLDLLWRAADGLDIDFLIENLSCSGTEQTCMIEREMQTNIFKFIILQE